MIASLDADDLMATLRQLAGEARLAIYDAYGPSFLSGGEVQSVTNDLIATIDKAEVWLEAEAAPGDPRRACVRGEFTDSSQVSLRTLESSRVSIGVIASEAAAGYMLPVAIRDEDTLRLAVLDKMVPLAVADLDALQAASIYDARNISGQLRITAGSGTTVRGSKRFVGLWHIIDDLTLGMVTVSPNRFAEVRFYVQVDAVENNRGLEIGLVVDFIEADADRPAVHVSALGVVPVSAPHEFQVPLDVDHSFVEASTLRWTVKIDQQAETVTPWLNGLPPAPGQVYVNKEGLCIFNAADAGRQFKVSYWQQANQFSNVDVLTPTPTTAVFSQRKDVISGMNIILFPTPGPHVIQLAIRGDGSVGRATLMGRVIPRDYSEELAALTP